MKDKLIHKIHCNDFENFVRLYKQNLVDVDTSHFCFREAIKEARIDFVNFLINEGVIQCFDQNDKYTIFQDMLVRKKDHLNMQLFMDLFKVLLECCMRKWRIWEETSDSINCKIYLSVERIKLIDSALHNILLNAVHARSPAYVSYVLIYMKTCGIKPRSHFIKSVLRSGCIHMSSSACHILGLNHQKIKKPKTTNI